MDTADARPSRRSQLPTIVGLFVILRVTIVFLYTPQGLLNAYTDYHHYYRIAQLSDQGFYPYINSWSEYPPLLIYTSQLVYRAAQSIAPMGGVDSFGYQLFARMLGSLMLLFETGVLILIHHIVARARGVDKANWSAWVYSTLSLPLFFWNASQTSSVTFFLLLAMYWFIAGRHTRSAVALGLGIATKLVPIFLLASAIKFLLPRWKSAISYSLVAILIVTLVFVPFGVLGGSRWIAASFTSLLTRASYATPWALIDGNGGSGDVGDVLARTQIDQAAVIHGNPPAISPILIAVLFAIVYGLIFHRAICTPSARSGASIEPRGAQQFIWFSTFTAMVFHLWSKGWSPQWATLLIPLLLLSFPDRRGLWLALLLTGVVFLEWPVADALHSQLLLAIAILGRTAIFIGVAVMTIGPLLGQPPGASLGQSPVTSDVT